MKRLLILIPIICLLFCGEWREGSDWPTFRGNYHRNGYSPDMGPSDTPEIVWQIDLGAKALASPVVAGGRLYQGYHEGMICLEPYTGEIIREFSTEKKVFSTPSYYQGDIVFGCWDKNVYRLQGDGGKVVWYTTFPAAVDCSPVAADNAVYVGDFTGLFAVMDFETGSVGKAFNTGDWLVGSAAYDGEYLYFGGRNSIFYAVSRNGLRPAWQFDAGGDISGTPVIDTSHVYFGSNNMKFHCLDRETGVKKWELDTNGAMFSSPALHDGKLYFGCTDSTIYCLYADTGDEIWTYRTEGIIYSSAAVCGNRVYIGCHDGYIYALDTETGALIWKEFLGTFVTSSPAVYDDMLFIANDLGTVFAFR